MDEGHRHLAEYEEYKKDTTTSRLLTDVMCLDDSPNGQRVSHQLGIGCLACKLDLEMGTFAKQSPLLISLLPSKLGHWTIIKSHFRL